MSIRINSLAAGAIFKNEAPYIIDWLSWHRAIGVTRFVIADNDSTDGTTEILAILHKLGIVTHVPFPGRLHINPQLEAYWHICKYLRGISDWVALIDADEFICPTSVNDDLSGMLSQLSVEIGGVAINWAIFGSSGHLDASTDPVFMRFIRRAMQHTPINRVEASNRHYKSIVRPEAVSERPPNPHFLTLMPRWRYARIDGQPLVHDEPPMFGISKDVDWGNFRINHYVIKSSAEFFNKKLTRGLADQHGFVRHHSFFRRHDFNDIEDRPAEWILQRFFQHRANLMSLLGPYAGLVEKALADLMELLPSPVLPTETEYGNSEPPMNTAAPGVRVAPKWRRKLRNHYLSLKAIANRYRKTERLPW